MGKYGCAGTAVAVVLIVLVIVLGSSARTVDAGETCVVVRFGEIRGHLSQGLHFVTPLVTSLRCYPLRTVVYETSDQPNESKADYTDFTVDANTSDGQQVQITFGVGFHIEPDEAEYVYRNVGATTIQVVERVVKFNARSVVRKIAQDFEASALYTGDIFRFEEDIRVQLETLFAAQHITLDTFALRKIAFDENYVQAIEQQQIAKEGIETARFQSQAAEFEANRTAALAKGDAQASIERATGNAEAVRIAAAAEADAIRLRGEALKSFPEVLQLNFIEALRTIQWMVLPSDIVPLIPFESFGGGQ